MCKEVNLPPRMQQILTVFQDRAEYVWMTELVEMAIYFNLATALQAYRSVYLERDTPSGTKQIPITFYSILMISSGSGKGYSISLAQKMFQPIFDNFITKIQHEIAKPHFRDDDDKLESSYLNITSPFIPMGSTPEGIQKFCQTLSTAGFGSASIVEDELGSTIMRGEPVFTKLKTLFDSGIASGNVVSGGSEQYFTVQDITTNCILAGSPGPFTLQPKKMEALHEALVSGMARRSFVYYNTDYRKSQNRYKDFETLDRTTINEFNEYVNELISHIHSLDRVIYSKEAKKYLTDWDIQKQVLRENTESILGDDLGAVHPIERLAALICVLELDTVVTSTHMEYAINFSERCERTSVNALRIKPMYEQIYDELAKRGFASRTELVKNIKDLNARTIDNEMELTIEHTNQLGNSIIKKEYAGIVKYKLERLSQTKLDNIILSINEDMIATNPQGFSRAIGDFETLHKVLCGNYRYSAGTFLNEYIKDANYLSEQNLICIDFDQGSSIDEIKRLFHDIKYLIATTKSHQKEKNGEVCDRFRLVLPTSSTFHLKPDTYAAMYQNLIESLGLTADKQTKNCSRWYYSNPDGEYWYNPNQSAELLDMRPFIDSAAEQLQAKAHKAYEREQTSGTASDEFRLERAYKWFLSQTTNGNRNDMTFRFGIFVKEHLQSIDWNAETEHFNKLLGDPLKQNEITKIISSISRS